MAFIYTYITADGTNLNWTDAKAAAVARGGTLAFFANQAELNSFNTYIASGINYSPGGWIGYTDTASEGNYKDITGSAIGVSNWKGGEPNNAFGDEHYAAVIYGGDFNGKWNDENLEATNYNGVAGYFLQKTVTLTYQVIDNDGVSAAGRNGDNYSFAPVGVGSSDAIAWDFGDGNIASSTGTAAVTHLYELADLTPGADITVTMTVNSQNITATIPLYYISLEVPADDLELTSLPFSTELATYKNAQPVTLTAASINWYVTRRDDDYPQFEPLDSATSAAGVGYTPSISQYHQGSTALAIVDDRYRIRAKFTGSHDGNSISIWMDQTFSLNISPDVDIINISNDDTIGHLKTLVGSANTTEGTNITSQIVWSAYLNGTGSSVLSYTGGALRLSDHPGIAIGSTYKFVVSITSNGQVVTNEKTNITIETSVAPLAEMDLNTLFLHPVQKSTARVLWQGNWFPLMDDMRDGARRSFSGALGGGVVGADSTASLNIGTGVYTEGDPLYNATVGSIPGLGGLHDYYNDYVLGIDSGKADGKIPNHGYPGTTHFPWNSAGTTDFAMSEFYGVVLHCFYVVVKNDTSGTLYTTDGNGSIRINNNMGTGASTTTINGTAYSGLTNNLPKTVAGFEGGSIVHCSTSATYGTIGAVTTVYFTVTVNRDSNSWSLRLGPPAGGGTTYTSPNNQAMFFYTGADMPGANRAAQYGSP